MLFHLPQKEGNVFCFMKLAACSEGWVWQHSMTLCLICLGSHQICKCSVGIGKWTIENETQCVRKQVPADIVAQFHTHTHTHTHTLQREKEDFVLDPFGERQPVHSPQARGDAIPRLHTGHTSFMFLSNKFSTCLK